MRLNKKRAEELLSEVEDKLGEARKNVRQAKTEVEILACSKAYLEFIIHGLKRNPSLKKVDIKDE